MNPLTKEFIDRKREKMIREQLICRGISTPEMIDVFRKVPRHEFVTDAQKHLAYEDCALPYRLNQTVSQPYIVAYMTEAVFSGNRDNVLEIGTGSGYQTAILAELFQNVYSIEFLKELSLSAQKKLSRLGYNNIHFSDGDGHRGWREFAPFDAIVVTCAPVSVPAELKAQLNPNEGKMIIPVGRTHGQKLLQITRTAENYEERFLEYVSFVPMHRSSGQHSTNGSDSSSTTDRNPPF